MRSGANHLQFTIRPYHPADRLSVRRIYGTDDFARPHLMQKYPRMSEYLADSMSHYIDYEPESTFVTDIRGQVVGALLGAVDARRADETYERHVRPLLVGRCLTGRYGWPGWLWAILRTELASRSIEAPEPDLRQYPAHLHIGVLPQWRRQGMGTALMAHYEDYLLERDIAGYHLYAASFHPLGMAFYRKLELEQLGEFQWRFHNGVQLMTVVETIFGRRLLPTEPG